MTIVEFLTARLDQEAEAWSGGTGLITQPNFASLSRYALADIAAKRAIVEIHQPERGPDTWYWLERRCKGCGSGWHKWIPDRPPTEIGPERGCPTLRALASVYADHPDYREEWKP